MAKSDIVYYWAGGRRVGRWNPSYPTISTEETLRRFKLAGYVAHPGLKSIGPPEGAPSDAEFKALGL